MDQFFGQSTQEPAPEQQHSGISVLIAAVDQVNKEINNLNTPQG